MNHTWRSREKRIRSPTEKAFDYYIALVSTLEDIKGTLWRKCLLLLELKDEWSRFILIRSLRVAVPPPLTPKFHLGGGEGTATSRLFNPLLCAYQLHSSAVLHIVFVSFFFSSFRQLINFISAKYTNHCLRFLIIKLMLGSGNVFFISVSEAERIRWKNTLLAASSFIHQLIIYLFISLSKYYVLVHM